MRALFWVLSLFAVAVLVALLASVNSGYALLVLPPYRVQISLNLLLFLLLMLFIGGHALLRVISRTVELPGRVGQFHRRRRKDKAGQALRDGIRCYLEGRYAQAFKLSSKAAEGGDGRGLAALFAARAAHAMRDDTRYRIWLGKAAEFDEEIRTARLMSEAELALEGRRFDEAEERLALLSQGGPRHVAALRIGVRTAQALGKWEEVLRLTRQLVKHKALSDDQARPMISRAHQERLRQLSGDATAMVEYWQGIPSQDLADSRLMDRAVPLLVASGQGGVAREAVERQLSREWDGGLVRYYGYCAENDALSALQRAEAWLLQKPRDAGLLFALGRLCMGLQLWGKAQSYLEASLAIEPSVETHLALASLGEQLERGNDAQGHYQAAARLAARKG